MTIKEMLDLGEPIFNRIDEAIRRERFSDAYQILDNAQPIEWIKDMPSDATDGVYYHNDIELIEAICERVFWRWWYEIVGQPTLTTTKSGVIITVTVKTTVAFAFSDTYRSQSGVASEFVTNAKFIQLSTPKAATMAFKNSMRKFGNIFGKSLNRGIENQPIENTGGFSFQPQDEFISGLVGEIRKSETVEQLALLKKGLPPSLNTVYMDKLKELTKTIQK